MAHLVRLHEGTCGGWEPRQRPGIVITNPPWGNRLMALEYDAPNQLSALEAAWTELGLFLKVCSDIHCNRLMLTGSCQPQPATPSAAGSLEVLLFAYVRQAIDAYDGPSACKQCHFVHSVEVTVPLMVLTVCVLA